MFLYWLFIAWSLLILPFLIKIDYIIIQVLIFIVLLRIVFDFIFFPVHRQHRIFFCVLRFLIKSLDIDFLSHFLNLQNFLIIFFTIIIDLWFFLFKFKFQIFDFWYFGFLLTSINIRLNNCLFLATNFSPLLKLKLFKYFFLYLFQLTLVSYLQ